jgi:NCAIR mutase (PurE)-related protein
MPENEVNLDDRRVQRLGFDEAIYCERKSIAQLETILARATGQSQSLLLTRLGEAQLQALPAAMRVQIDYDLTSRTGLFGDLVSVTGNTRIAVVSAGSSDVAVAREAVRTLRYYGQSCIEIYDVGVAGLWRLTERLDSFRECAVVIAVAGMDAALPSVIGGLVPGLVIGLPTSTGYGAAEGGQTALKAMLASCAPGLLVVNIDNGYGAACAALRALRPL